MTSATSKAPVLRSALNSEPCACLICSRSPGARRWKPVMRSGISPEPMVSGKPKRTVPCSGSASPATPTRAVSICGKGDGYELRGPDKEAGTDMVDGLSDLHDVSAADIHILVLMVE